MLGDLANERRLVPARTKASCGVTLKPSLHHHHRHISDITFDVSTNPFVIPPDTNTHVYSSRRRQQQQQGMGEIGFQILQVRIS